MSLPSVCFLLLLLYRSERVFICLAGKRCRHTGRIPTRTRGTHDGRSTMRSIRATSASALPEAHDADVGAVGRTWAPHKILTCLVHRCLFLLSSLLPTLRLCLVRHFFSISHASHCVRFVALYYVIYYAGMTGHAGC